MRSSIASALVRLIGTAESRSSLPHTSYTCTYWSKSSKRPWRSSRDWSIRCISWSRKLALVGLEKRRLWVGVINIYKYLMKGGKEEEARLLVVPTGRARSNNHTSLHLNIRRKFFCCEGYQTLEQFTQRCGGVSSLGNIQSLIGHSLEQPAAVSPALRRGWLDKTVFCILKLLILYIFCKEQNNIWAQFHIDKKQ